MNYVFPNLKLNHFTNFEEIDETFDVIQVNTNDVDISVLELLRVGGVLILNKCNMLKEIIKTNKYLTNSCLYTSEEQAIMIKIK